MPAERRVVTVELRPHRRLATPGPRPQPLLPPATVECPRCERRLPEARWEEQLRVCAHCGHHARVPARLRITQLADPGTVELMDLPARDTDPLRFDDGLPYPERLRSARAATGSSDAVVVAAAAIGGMAALIVSMEFAFMGGSLGSAAGGAFAVACDRAVAERRPLVAVCVSGGARMQEGIVALAQMARCTVGTSALAAAALPYLTVLADPCFGGVTASFATQADVILAEPRARIGFAGGRVIEQATYERLPEGFQTAEFLLAHGMIDQVVERSRLRDTVRRVLLALSSAGPR
ncbi:MAG TPA: acetyl-CoA carboxylase carboxyltransferase subunit beta [Candidatus Dormibacteraeota bacterium]